MPYSGGSTPLQPPPLLSADPAAAAAAAAEALCCPICCDLLLGPVVTPCGHAFCQDCFEAWCAHAAARWQARGGLHCPVCRAQLPRALTFCGGPGSRPPLSPCTVLADSVALLCPGRLAQRTAQRATEQAAAAAAAAVAVAPGPPAIGGGNGGGGGGIGRLLLAWVARQRRRLAATLLRRVPAPEVALGAALLGMYSAAFIVITISSLLDLFSASARLRRLLTHLQQLERRGAAGGGGGGGAAWEDSWRRLAAVQLELVRQLASFLSGQEQAGAGVAGWPFGGGGGGGGGPWWKGPCKGIGIGRRGVVLPAPLGAVAEWVRRATAGGVAGGGEVCGTVAKTAAVRHWGGRAAQGGAQQGTGGASGDGSRGASCAGRLWASRQPLSLGTAVAGKA